MTKMELNEANEHALEKGINLSIQQAKYDANKLELKKFEDCNEIMGYTMQGLTENEAKLFIFKNRHSHAHKNKSSSSQSINHFKIHDFGSYVTELAESEFRSIDQAKSQQFHHVDKLAQKCSCNTNDHEHHKCDHTLCHGIKFKEEHVLHHGMSEFYHQSLEATSPQHHILHHGLTFSNQVGLKCAHFNHHHISPVVSEDEIIVTPFKDSNEMVSNTFLIQNFLLFCSLLLFLLLLGIKD
jgi:hypothetical protein